MKLKLVVGVILVLLLLTGTTQAIRNSWASSEGNGIGVVEVIRNSLASGEGNGIVVVELIRNSWADTPV